MPIPKYARSATRASRPRSLRQEWADRSAVSRDGSEERGLAPRFPESHSITLPRIVSLRWSMHDGAWYQRRWQTGFDGKETNVDEKRVDYVLGSGNHAKTYLHLTEKNTLQELPLGWYAEKGGYWAMNPGYDRRTTRARCAPSITSACSATTDIPRFRRARTRTYPGDLREALAGGHRLPALPRARTEARRQSVGGRQRGGCARRDREPGPAERGAPDGGLPPVPSGNIK